MSKNRNRRSQDLAATTQAREGELLVKDQGGQSMAFTFGDPVPVLEVGRSSTIWSAGPMVGGMSRQYPWTA